ncbi:DUF892 family protein [bacterium]|nr:DUF892 family protein [bacterium]
MAAYRGACRFADQLGLKEALALLKQSLEEEISSDHLLTEISKDNKTKALASHQTGWRARGAGSTDLGGVKIRSSGLDLAFSPPQTGAFIHLALSLATFA